MFAIAGSIRAGCATDSATSDLAAKCRTACPCPELSGYAGNADGNTITGPGAPITVSLTKTSASVTAWATGP